MKAVIFSMLTVLAASSSAWAYRTCSCHELNRRASGLNFAASRAPMDNWERQDVRQDADYAYSILARADRMPEHRKESMCSSANQAVDYNWVRWQPWVATHGGDVGNPCERRY